MTTIASALPRWDLSGIFPAPGSREFAAAQEGLGAEVARLVGLYDRHRVRAGTPHDPTDAEVEAFEEVLAATNELAATSRLVVAYLNGYVTTDASDDASTRLLSQVQTTLTDSQRLSKRFEGWVATLGADALIARSPEAADHAYALRRAEAAARHQMTEDEESLYADLGLTGGSAWNRLHGEVSAQLTAHVSGFDAPLPITVVRGLATSPDREVRQAAYEGELAAWETVAVPLAAAMNAIKGEANTVNRRRGWSDPLEPALWANGVDRATLAAMQEAAVASFPDFRRYLVAKAALVGGGGPLEWWDLFAPVAPTGGGVDWPTAVESVEAAFGAYSGPLANLVRRAVSERWIDAEPRVGKRGGAFCMSVRDDESRVLLNFDGSWDSVQTLAHELGHAYHNSTLGPRTPMQRQTPMALAETASIFCETLMVAAGLAAASPEQRLALLDTDLAGSCQVVVDIHSRFLFESEVFARRQHGTLGVPELCEMMVEAQAATYGVALASHHRFAWAVKPHYYSTAFYNWPYTFGLLFGIGLYARYEADPERFRAGYDDLLSSTGLGSAAELAAGFGIDVRSVGFWTDSLDVIRSRIDDYVRLSS